MKRIMNVKLAAMLCMCMASSSIVFAVPTIGALYDFESDPNIVSPLGWDGASGDNGTVSIVSETSTPGIPNDTLIFQVSGAMASGDGYVYTETDEFIGNYTLSIGSQATIKFEFLDGASNADQLSLFFHSSGTGETWLFPWLSPSIGTYAANIGTSTGWQTWDATPDFAGSILTVDRIGLFVVNKNSGTFTYHMDNFELGVPEPETVWMIVAVVLSLAVTFRGKLAEVAGQLKARFAKI